VLPSLTFAAISFLSSFRLDLVLLKVSLLNVRISSQTGYLCFYLFKGKKEITMLRARACVFWRMYVYFIFDTFEPVVVFLTKLV